MRWPPVFLIPRDCHSRLPAVHPGKGLPAALLPGQGGPIDLPLRIRGTGRVGRGQTVGSFSSLPVITNSLSKHHGTRLVTRRALSAWQRRILITCQRPLPVEMTADLSLPLPSDRIHQPAEATVMPRDAAVRHQQVTLPPPTAVHTSGRRKVRTYGIPNRVTRTSCGPAAWLPESCSNNKVSTRLGAKR